MPLDMYYPSRRPDGTAPRTEPQNTDKAAQEALAQAGAGALKPAPAVPRAIQDVIDELNAVRQRLSELWAAEYKANNWGSVRHRPGPPMTLSRWPAARRCSSWMRRKANSCVR